MSKSRLSEEAVKTIIGRFQKGIPLISGVRETSLHLNIVVLPMSHGYEIRFFPELSEASVAEAKEEYRQNIERLTQEGKADILAQLPISLEDMVNKPANEFNPQAIWRLDFVDSHLKVLGEHGYKLNRFALQPDPVLGGNVVALSYVHETLQDLDLFLEGMPLSDHINRVLQAAHMVNQQQAAQERVEAAAEKLETPGLILPGDADFKS